MCDALSITSVALIAAGTAATYVGYQQAEKAQAGATEAELARQRNLQKQSDEVLARTIQGNAGKTTEEAAKKQTAAREASYAPAAAQTGVYRPPGVERSPTDTVNRIVSDAYQQQGEKASGYVQQQGQARAAMEGLSDQFLNNAIFTQDQANKLQMLGSFMKGSADVLPYELAAAGHRGDSAKTLGGILSALGSVTGAAGATGGLGSLLASGAAASGSAANAGAYRTVAEAQAAYPTATSFIKTWRGYYPASKAQPIT